MGARAESDRDSNLRWLVRPSRPPRSTAVETSTLVHVRWIRGSSGSVTIAGTPTWRLVLQVDPTQDRGVQADGHCGFRCWSRTRSSTAPSRGRTGPTAPDRMCQPPRQSWRSTTRLTVMSPTSQGRAAPRKLPTSWHESRMLNCPFALLRETTVRCGNESTTAFPLRGPCLILLSSREGTYFCWPPTLALTWPRAQPLPRSKAPLSHPQQRRRDGGRQ